MEKLCKKCGHTKPTAEFYAHTRNRDGLQHWCKECQKTAILSGYKNNPEKHAAYNREWGRRNRASRHESHLKERYRIPRGTYPKLFAAQGGRCAICGDPPTSTRLHVDHCHDTGIIRGLLCSRCNFGIGNFRHDQSILRNAITYLSSLPQ